MITDAMLTDADIDTMRERMAARSPLSAIAHDVWGAADAHSVWDDPAGQRRTDLRARSYPNLRLDHQRSGQWRGALDHRLLTKMAGLVAKAMIMQHQFPLKRYVGPRACRLSWTKGLPPWPETRSRAGGFFNALPRRRQGAAEVGVARRLKETRAGRIAQIAPWGDCGAIYVEGERGCICRLRVRARRRGPMIALTVPLPYPLTAADVPRAVRARCVVGVDAAAGDGKAVQRRLAAIRN